MQKKLISIVTALLASTSLVACGGGGNTSHPAEGSLTILAYNGGYGIEWLNEICAEFENRTGIICTPSTDSTILEKMDTQLTNKQSDYDIFMSHGLNWQNYANRGLLANLDELYESEVEGIKFKDRFSNGAAELSKYEGRDSDGNNVGSHYYKVAFTQGAGGLVFNSTLFEQHNWKVPTTYDELMSLCQQIITDTNGTVKPFTWAGSGESRDYYWDYLIYEWWAELAGEDFIQEWLEFKGSDGTYSTGYENFDPNGKFKEFKQAYEMWYNLIAKHPEYSIPNAQATTLLSAQVKFFDGEAAMMPYGQWAKKEVEMAMDEEFEFDVKFMRTPRVSADSEYYNFMVGFGDSMIVPQNSPNKEAAMEFLKFMSTEYACKKFVEKAEGPFLAFDYSDIDMSDLRSSDTYIDSLYTIVTDSVNISHATNSPMVVLNSDQALQPWINNTRYYVDAMDNPNNNTPDLVLDRVYSSAYDSWARFCSNAGVR